MTGARSEIGDAGHHLLDLPIECSRLATVTGPVPDGDHLVPLLVADVKRPRTKEPVRSL